MRIYGKPGQSATLPRGTGGRSDLSQRRTCFQPGSASGGIKQSGLGREGGKVGIEEFLEIKYTALAVQQICRFRLNE